MRIVLEPPTRAGYELLVAATKGVDRLVRQATLLRSKYTARATRVTSLAVPGPGSLVCL